MLCVLQAAQKSITNSTARMTEGTDIAYINLFGAPCNVSPPFTFHELRQNYLGCQNLPTALWIQKFIQKDIIPEELRTEDEIRTGKAESERNDHGIRDSKRQTVRHS